MSVSVFDYPLGLVPGFEKIGFDADEKLRALAVESVRAATPEVGVFEGRIATGDQFVASSEQKTFIHDTFDALCCEMEGAAVAQVARFRGRLSRIRGHRIPSGRRRGLRDVPEARVLTKGQVI